MKGDGVVFPCCQAIQKYLPAEDVLFVEIARQVPNAQFVFVIQPWAPVEPFRQRLNREFTLHGLNPDQYLVFHPFLEPTAYLGLHLTSNVFLDSIGFSGFNTTADAIACGLPIVTLPGKLFRGRQSYGLLTQMKVTDTIARDCDHYVELAVRLAHEPEWRRSISERMLENCGKVFNDQRSIKALEDFLFAAVAAHPDRIRG